MIAAFASLALAAAVVPPAASGDADFRAIYRTLVETDTSTGLGNCTLAASRMSAALIHGGIPQDDIHLYEAPAHPHDGGLVVVAHGTDPVASALLLVAHIDVIDVDRGQWASDPFKLTETSGYFRGRGVSDNKAMAAALVESIIRLRREKVRLRRDVKVALTCGEENADGFNGAHYLATERRDLIEAGLAFVPSGGGTREASGQPATVTLEAGEKRQVVYILEARGTGSHASRPTPDNAITTLSAALVRLGAYRFPAQLNDVTRLTFSRAAERATPMMKSAIERLLDDPTDLAAQTTVSVDPTWNAMLRTTCAATTIKTGGQVNTIAPLATATINCRLLPNTDAAAVTTTLRGLLTTPASRLIAATPPEPMAPFPPVTPDLLVAVEQLAAATWPNARVVPAMLTGATDARHFNAVGIPTYGVTLVLNDADGDGVHAANERIRVQSVLEGREMVFALIRRFAGTSVAKSFQAMEPKP